MLNLTGIAKCYSLKLEDLINYCKENDIEEYFGDEVPEGEVWYDVPNEDKDEFACNFGIARYYIVEITKYGNTDIVVAMWNVLTEDYEGSTSYMADISDYRDENSDVNPPDGFQSKKDALEELEKIKRLKTDLLI